MGRLLDENTYVSKVASDFVEKLDSPTVRFMDKNPTPCVYYNINTDRTTIDDGLYTTERQLGTHSPVRYNRITNFPLYIDSNILLQLQDNDEGLTVTFEGDAVILPRTIEPYTDDYFYISYIGRNYLFRVTRFEYDTLKKRNYYKITFIIKSVDDDSDINDLELQVVERYYCELRNIGTEDRWLILEDDYASVLALNNIITEISELYLELYFIPNYNVLLYKDNNGRSIYDRYMTNFINRNNIFFKKFDYNSLIFAEVGFDNIFKRDYLTSFYRLMEIGKQEQVKDIPFILHNIMEPFCIFDIYNDRSVYGISFRKDNFGQWYFPKGILPEPKFKPKLTPLDLPIEDISIPDRIYQPKNPSPNANNKINNMGIDYPPDTDKTPELGDVDTIIENEDLWNNNSYENTDDEVENQDTQEENIQPSPPIISKPEKIEPSEEEKDVLNKAKENMYFNDKYIELSSDDVEIDIAEEPKEDIPIYIEILRGYFSGSLNRMSKIPVEKLSNMGFIEYSWETFISIPLLLFVLEDLFDKYMKGKHALENR